MRIAAYIVLPLALIGVFLWIIPSHKSDVDETVCDLKSAMREAAFSVDVAEGEDAEYRKIYINLLAAGELVVVASRRLRGVTIDFANNLDDRCLSTWLTAILRDVESVDRSQRFYQVSQRNDHYVPPLFFDVKKSYESIYNLAKDQSLRIQARSMWNEIEFRDYQDALDLWYERIPPHRGERPLVRKIQAWKKNN